MKILSNTKYFLFFLQDRLHFFYVFVFSWICLKENSTNRHQGLVTSLTLLRGGWVEGEGGLWSPRITHVTRAKTHARFSNSATSDSRIRVVGEAKTHVYAFDSTKSKVSWMWIPESRLITRLWLTDSFDSPGLTSGAIQEGLRIQKPGATRESKWNRLVDFSRDG